MKFFSYLLFALFFISCSSTNNFAVKNRASLRSPKSTHFLMTILHTNDLHGMMIPFDYMATPGSGQANKKNVGGLARRAWLVNELRSHSQNKVFLLEAGDIATRGPWHTTYFGKPEIGVMNYMKYDLMTIGNNEFKLTTDSSWESKMFDLLKQSNFPWLAANFIEVSTGKLPLGVSPFVILKADDRKIAFFAVTAPRVQTYSHVNQKYKIEDPIEVAKRLIPLLRSQADIVIAVTHIGVCQNSQQIALGSPCLDQELAAKVSGIDAIVGGDSHTFLPKPLGIKNPEGKVIPIVQTGEQGINLGKLDLQFDCAEKCVLENFSGQLIELNSSVQEDLQVKNYLSKFDIK